MLHMTSYKFGDVVLVPFPFTDLSINKKRPGVVVSSDAYHQDRADIILMAITSQVSATSRFGDVIITYWQEAGLLSPSIIKPIITTVENQLILRKLGQLKTADLEALQQTLTTILGG